MRGVAALAVVIHHHLLTLPGVFPNYPDLGGGPAWLVNSPLHVLWGGQEAVFFFFILSGFVLTLQVWQGRALDMVSFIPRRLWRLWVPLIVAVTVAWAFRVLVGNAPVAGASVWFNSVWQDTPLPAYLQHVLMLDRMDTLGSAFVPVVWSLKWEMWGSLLLPVVILIARQRGLVLAALGAFILFVTTQSVSESPFQQFLTYLPMFVLGAVLARWREGVAARFQALSSPVKVAMLMGSLLLVGAHWYAGPLRGWPLHLADMAVLVGAGLLLCLALGWTGMQAWLLQPALQWLGQVSYSLYLYHTLILLLVVRVGSPVLPLPALLMGSFLLAFPVAHLAHQWVELPAMKRGQRRTSVQASPASAAAL